MSRAKAIWLDEKRHPEKGEGPLHRADKAYFGYQQVAADEKAEKVLRHFNSVAPRYDLMNTLLSFGIHHLWKRTAIKVLGVNPGDWVIDVCGGTGDLSILAARSLGSSGRGVFFC
jgi:demethylmenaquinone methyltransferase/2-methoxy-6-polyprenyl-1,4-benzoquinol methylase